MENMTKRLSKQSENKTLKTIRYNKISKWLYKHIIEHKKSYYVVNGKV